MYIGYIRVSTDDQNLSLQKDALLKYGVDERNIFSDKTSGSKDKRVGLDKALEFGYLGTFGKNATKNFKPGLCNRKISI